MRSPCSSARSLQNRSRTKSHCPEEVCTVRVTKPDARPGPRRPPLRPSPGSAPDPAARSPARHPSLQGQSLPSPKATSPLNRPSVKPLLKRDRMLCSSAILQEDSGLKHTVPRALSGRPHVTVTRVPSPSPSLRSQTDPRGHVTCPQARHPKPVVCAARGRGQPRHLMQVLQPGAKGQRPPGPPTDLTEPRAPLQTSQTPSRAKR